MLKLYYYFLNKFSQFKYQFKEEIYVNTIMFTVNLFKFKRPDGSLFANYIASILPLIQKHTQFLLFMRRILHVLQRIFRFSGVKIMLSGKLNGFSRSQSKHIQIGCVSLQSVVTPYISGYSHAFTSAGKIGVKL
jgi:ribosomal protein S3